MLELGGKSAAVVFDDADLDLAAATVVQTALAGISGQGCVLPTRLLVHDAVYDEVGGEGGGDWPGRCASGARSTTVCRWAR